MLWINKFSFTPTTLGRSRHKVDGHGGRADEGVDGVDVETTKRQLGDDQGPSHSARGDPQENNGNSPGLAASCSLEVENRQLKQQKTEE